MVELTETEAEGDVLTGQSDLGAGESDSDASIWKKVGGCEYDQGMGPQRSSWN